MHGQEKGVGSQIAHTYTETTGVKQLEHLHNWRAIPPQLTLAHIDTSCGVAS